jgi:uncharacterized protein YdaL
MPALHDDVFDNGLNYIDTYTEKLYILKADPGLTWADIATHAVGNKATPAIAASANRSGGGREVVVSAITDGTVTATETASHFALTDDSATKILASGALASPQGVTSGNVFTLTQFAIGIPDPA